MFKKSTHAQSSIEFIILLGFLLFAFSAFFLIIQGNMSDKLDARNNMAIKGIAIQVQDEINFAFSSSEGYYREFKIPENINGVNYDIELGDGVVYVNQQDKYALSLPIKDFRGDIVKGNNYIKKLGGEVLLNLES